MTTAQKALACFLLGLLSFGLLGAAPPDNTIHATIVVNTTSDEADATSGSGVCATASGNCSLRAAIQTANANAGADSISFAIGEPNIAPRYIYLDSVLPAITEALTINGFTQPGGADIVLDGSNLAGATSYGLKIQADNSTIRGLTIRRFPWVGIYLEAASVTTITGNGGDGIYINGGMSNIIGGSASSDRNIISGNAECGIFLLNTTSNTIINNYIGLDFGGTTALENGKYGLLIADSDSNIIGNGTTATRNVFGKNGWDAIHVYHTSSENTIRGNYIGLNAAGTAGMGNTDMGIMFRGGQNNTIGGATAGERNIISGFAEDGIHLQNESPYSATNNVIQGNYIGTNAAGSAAIPNGTGMVLVGTTGTLIGGDGAGEGNLISGNTGIGISLGEKLTDSGTIIYGNTLGLNSAGAPLGNGNYNIWSGGHGDVQIGGASYGMGNIIAYSPKAGIHIQSQHNTIRGNSIYSNAGLGIAFFEYDVTLPNDVGDADVGGNDFLNFPVLVSATYAGNRLYISATYNSLPVARVMEFDFYSSSECDPNGYGEGEKYESGTIASTNSAGNLTLNYSYITNAIIAGRTLTLTATDPDGNTSQFSNCLMVTYKTYLPAINR
jgi:CSLREA domain-containing protein